MTTRAVRTTHDFSSHHSQGQSSPNCAEVPARTACQVIRRPFISRLHPPAEPWPQCWPLAACQLASLRQRLPGSHDAGPRKMTPTALIASGRRCPCTPQTSSHATAGSGSCAVLPELGRSQQLSAREIARRDDQRRESSNNFFARGPTTWKDTWKRAILEKSRRYHIIRDGSVARRDSSCARVGLRSCWPGPSATPVLTVAAGNAHASAAQPSGKAGLARLPPQDWP